MRFINTSVGLKEDFRNRFYWARVVDFDPSTSPTWQFDDEPPRSIKGFRARARKAQPFDRLQVTGSCEIEIGEHQNETFPGPHNPGDPGGGVTGADVLASQTFNNAGSFLVLPVAGRQSVSYSIPANTLIANLNCTYSTDGGASFPLPLNFVNGFAGGLSAGLLSVAASFQQGGILLPFGGITHIRITVQAYTSGSAVVSLRATSAPQGYSPCEQLLGGALATNTRALQVAGNDGVNLRALLTDSTGRLRVAPSASNPAIYDTTSGVNAALDTGILDVSGYSQLLFLAANSGGVPARSVFHVDDAGAQVLLFSFNNVGPVFLTWGFGAVASGPFTVAISGMVPRRIRVTCAAIIGQTDRVRIEGR